jgi:hypothetical protein
MKFIRFLLGGMFTLSTIFGCKKDSSPIVPPNPTPVIMPVEIGNRWVRQITLYDTSGVPFYSGIDSIIVLRDTLISNKRCFVLPLKGAERVLSNQSDGLSWYLGTFGWGLEYKYPGLPGDSFYYIGSDAVSRIVATDSVLTVPAGTFSCYHYSTFINPSYPIHGRLEEYVAPNLGFVQSEWFQSVSASSPLFLYSRIKLMSVKLN